jgi:hypothetical protein
MNAIKFRVWDIVDSIYWNTNDGLYFFLNLPDPNLAVAISGFLVDKRKDRFVVQQFTGLYDFNKNEIYEGDILKCEVNSKTLITTVVYSLDVFDFGFRTENLKIEGWKYSEIVGNIYETPHLNPLY